MSSANLEGKILEYLYRKPRQVAKKITGGLMRTKLYRNINGTKMMTQEQVRKTCLILEQRGELVCIGKEKGPYKHKVYALSRSKRLEMEEQKGIISFREAGEE